MQQLFQRGEAEWKGGVNDEDIVMHQDSKAALLALAPAARGRTKADPIQNKDMMGVTN
eukprot:CAMPEP_0114143342 /NCGR_PEP_ID=MMETSP0043_2-20121206/18936_1 /TAXON_ID=464988 /ORGANISM="Hemiselmis andersenii, Strain CCMP644" /LENGTH=57 /DNA_ID=CAMNT_0001237635 /DNA_START=163 /DNA_END=337 /DNA_ORIENTATION=+